MECSVSIRCILSSMHIVMIFANVLQHGYFYQKYMFAYQIQEKMSGRVLMAKDMIFGSFLFVGFLWSIRVKKAKRKTGKYLILIGRMMKFSFFLKYVSISKQKVNMKESELGIKTHEVWTDKVEALWTISWGWQRKGSSQQWLRLDHERTSFS